MPSKKTLEIFLEGFSGQVKIMFASNKGEFIKNNGKLLNET